MATRKSKTNQIVFNCGSSRGTDSDWGFDDAASANHTDTKVDIAKSHDLREDWWTIRDQRDSGACVGFAIADGLLRWHYYKAKMISKDELPSPRFIWMANKETDNFTAYPTTFLDAAGTSTKLGLRVAQRFGSVFEHMLPMFPDGDDTDASVLSKLRPNVFFAIAASYRITGYYNLGARDLFRDEGKGFNNSQLNVWRRWIAQNGPVLTRLDVDQTWMDAKKTKGKLKTYTGNKHGGHAVCLVGYTPTSFIVRNSWGTKWGDGGFAYVSNAYARKAFTESYGAVLKVPSLEV